LKNNATKPTNFSIWIFIIFLILVGVGLLIQTILTLNNTKVIVEWSTASELDTVGFNLLRGETTEGPFEQVNKNLIPSSSDMLTGASYSYEDGSAQAGITYFYLLEEVESSGNTNQHGPIVVEASSPAKTKLMIAALLISGAVTYTIILLRVPKQQEPPPESI